MPPSEPKSSGEAELLTYPSGALNSLSGGTTDQIVSLGKVDISSAILSGRATARLNEQSNAEFVFDWRLAGFVDYSAPLIVQRPSGSEAPTIVFYGDVGTAEVDDGVARVVAAGMEQLRESTLPAFSGANLHPAEVVYTIIASSRPEEPPDEDRRWSRANCRSIRNREASSELCAHTGCPYRQGGNFSQRARKSDCRDSA